MPLNILQYTDQSPPPIKNHQAQNVSSAETEKSCFKGKRVRFVQERRVCSVRRTTKLCDNECV